MFCKEFVKTHFEDMKKYSLVLLLIAITLFISKISRAGDKIDRTFEVREFSSIYLKGPYKVHLRQAEECALSIIASESAFEEMEVSSTMGRLSIEIDKKNFKTNKNIEIFIQFKDLTKLEIVGAVDLNCDTPLKVTNLKLEFEGAGNVELDLQANKLISEIDGVGNFRLTGSTDYHKVVFSGVGKYDARNLLSTYTVAESNGIGSVSVHARNKFKGEANGIGSVEYYGDPDEVSVQASGIGSVKPR